MSPYPALAGCNAPEAGIAARVILVAALPVEQDTPTVVVVVIVVIVAVDRQVVKGGQMEAGVAASHPDPDRIASHNRQIVAAPAVRVAAVQLVLAALLVLRYSMYRSTCMMIESMSLPIPVVQSCSRGSYYHILPIMHSRLRCLRAFPRQSAHQSSKALQLLQRGNRRGLARYRAAMSACPALRSRALQARWQGRRRVVTCHE